MTDLKTLTLDAVALAELGALARPTAHDPALPACPICAAPALAGYAYTAWQDIAHDCRCTLTDSARYDRALRVTLWPERTLALKRQRALLTGRADYLASLPDAYRLYTWASLPQNGDNAHLWQSLKPESNLPTILDPLATGGRGTLYLHGTPGTGKTHAACAIGAELCSSMVTKFWAARQLKVQMQAAALGNAEWPDLFSPDLLILDDLDKLKPSEFTYEWLFDLLERRITCRRGTIITSQFAPGTTARKVTPADDQDSAAPLASRLGAGRVLKLGGQDHRYGMGMN